MSEPSLEARDPNTSPKRLAELLYGFTDGVLENPALPLVLLENPGWLSEAQIEPLLKLLLRPALPGYLVKVLTQHPKPAIATNAHMHVALGEAVTDWEPCLQNLAALHCSKDDRAILEKHELIPGWLAPYLEPLPPPKQTHTNPRKPKVQAPLSEERKQTLLASTEDQQWRIAASSKSAREVEFLLEQVPDRVAQYAAGNSITPIIWLERLIETPRCLYGLSGNSAMTSELLSKLIDRIQVVGPDFAMDRIGLHPACTPELATRLKERRVPEAYLRRFCSSTELEALFLAGKDWALDEVRNRNDVPQWLMAEALMQEIQKRRAYLPWFCGLLTLDDQKRLTKNVRSANWFTRLAIAIHPSTMPKTLEKLVSDANRYVRFVVKARIDDPAWSFAHEAGCHGST